MRILIVDDSAMMRAMIKRVVGLAQVPVDEILEANGCHEPGGVRSGKGIAVHARRPLRRGEEVLFRDVRHSAGEQVDRVRAE